MLYRDGDYSCHLVDGSFPWADRGGDEIKLGQTSWGLLICSISVII